MRGSLITRSVLITLILSATGMRTNAQTFPFTSGPIPLCDTSVFTANVTGVGMIYPPGTPWSMFLSGVTINITSDHPQTLSITLTSPAGTTLLLSAFNGAGGQNYTNTNFMYGAWSPITSGTAPFSGDWQAQGGSLSAFDYQNANGPWTITVVDTSCATGGTGPGGTWTPGWFDGSAAGGGFAFGYSGPPPCPGWIPFGSASICPGGTADILGFYTASNPWLNYNITQFSSPVADPSAVSTPGTYSVEGIDPMDGCIYWASYDIVLDIPIDLGPDQVVDVCDDGSSVDLTALFNVTGSSSIWTFNGTPLTSTAASAAATPGVYGLVVSTNSGCSDSVQVILNSSVGIDLGPDQSVSFCTAGNVDLTSLYDVTGGIATWSLGGAIYPTPTAASDAGVYSISVSTPGGCTDLAEVTVTLQEQPDLGPDQAYSICASTDLDLTPLFNATGYLTEWTYLGAPVQNPTSVILGGPYQLVASSGSACSDTAFVTIALLPSPDLGPDLFATVCDGESEDITGMFVTNGLNTTWTFGGLPIAEPTALTEAGSYLLVATNSDGCADSAVVELEVVAPPTIGPDQALERCVGDIVDLTALYPTGSAQATWTLNGLPVPTPTAVSTAGNYQIIMTNGSGCSSTAMVTISFAQPPILNGDQAITICEGASVDLPALYSTTGLTAVWSLGGSPIADPSAVTVGGNYRLVVINSAGCTDTAWVQVVVNPLPSLGADLSFTLCPWQTADLVSAFATDASSVTYSLNGQPVPQPELVAEAGTYVIFATDGPGCTDEALATVVNIECACTTDFIHDAQCLQDPVQFTLVADSTVLAAHWEFGGAASPSNDQDPFVSFITGGSVNVLLEATLTCGVVQVERSIMVPDCSDLCSVWIPSSFTPDGDGINDQWAWNCDCMPKEFEMTVYDRLGELIFASKNPSNAWDGTYKGKPVPPGVFVYRVDYRLPYQKNKEVLGAVTLVR